MRKGRIDAKTGELAGTLPRCRQTPRIPRRLQEQTVHLMGDLTGEAQTVNVKLVFAAHDYESEFIHECTIVVGTLKQLIAQLGRIWREAKWRAAIAIKGMHSLSETSLAFV